MKAAQIVAPAPRRARLEKSLRGGEAKTVALPTDSADAIVLYDSQLRVSYANDHAAGLMGLPAGFLQPGVSFREIVKFQFQHDQYENQHATLAEEIHSRLQFLNSPSKTRRIRRRPKDGTWLEETTMSLPNGSWIVVEKELSGQEVSQAPAQSANAELTSSFRFDHFCALADNTPDMISVKDRQGRYLFLNKGFVEWSDLQVDDLMGRSAFDMYPRSKAEEIWRLDHEVLKTGSTTVNVMELPFPNGSNRMVQCTRFPLISADGEVVALGSINRNIEDSYRVDRLKDEFISTVSHEMRTPLTSIRGSLELMRANVVGQIPATAIEMLDIAFNNTDRLLSLINELLDLQKLGSGKYQLRLQKFHVIEFLRQSLADLAGIEREYGVSFVLRQSTDIGEILADRNRLSQVMGNLLSNAAKFSPEGSIVEVGANRLSNNRVRVWISDRGAGIPEQFKEAIFNRFTQFDKSNKRKFGGTGLGLAISKAIIDLHDGLLNYKSRVGVGSVFYFEMALVVPEQAFAGEDRRRRRDRRKNPVGSRRVRTADQPLLDDGRSDSGHEPGRTTGWSI